ncbi:tRNA (guanosine(46)-N7)-methyltransferase TrmB [Crossiella cryophila]|uniref:tRNA (guanine-N(7)-)-methyltransferase n=1 Tax=Crossiella cryophila TaxID=43355 RepID=A0A7W7FRF6_9PSEU|nr:tRNA (guanosine(46)-N7)-methyltransferase TrmB [Crossiella cryophila]MBB4674885.1 tRNA (guanine-N7-)-methyltransferase [Crossiella cryophila]
MTSTGQDPVRPAHWRTVVSFVQRTARLSPGQERAYQQYWPTLGRKVDELGKDPVDFDAWFGRPAPVLLEIGSGMGETTAQLTAAAPELNYVAAEVYKPGLAQLLLRVEKLGLTNLRLLRGDAVTLLRENIPADSLHGVRIFFPDPWPKKKHHKRRLVQPEFVALAASRIRPGGTLHLATDWEQYSVEMMAACRATPLLRNRFADQPGGWAPRPDWRPVTKFEQRAHEEGRVIHDLIFERS